MQYTPGRECLKQDELKNAFIFYIIICAWVGQGGHGGHGFMVLWIDGASTL